MADVISAHEVRKIAVRNGYAIERTGIAKNLTYVRLTGPDGREVDESGVLRVLGRAAAKCFLEALLEPALPGGLRSRQSHRSKDRT